MPESRSSTTTLFNPQLCSITHQSFNLNRTLSLAPVHLIRGSPAEMRSLSLLKVQPAGVLPLATDNSSVQQFTLDTGSNNSYALSSTTTGDGTVNFAVYKLSTDQPPQPDQVSQNPAHNSG